MAFSGHPRRSVSLPRLRPVRGDHWLTANGPQLEIRRISLPLLTERPDRFMESATVSGSRERMFHCPTNLPAVKAGRVGRRLCLRVGAVRGPSRAVACYAELVGGAVRRGEG